MFGFLKKPKLCQQCGNETPKLHTVYLPSFSGQLSDKPVGLCTECLQQATVSALHAFPARAVYVEPICDDNYGFYPFSLEKDREGIIEPLSSFLSSSADTCQHCSKRARFCWTPLETWHESSDLKFNNKSAVSGSIMFCEEHMASHFIGWIKSKGYYLHEHRLPYGGEDGGCY